MLKLPNFNLFKKNITENQKKTQRILISDKIPRNTGNLSNVKNLEQLLSSYLVAGAIIEIREEHQRKLENQGAELLPVLEVNNKRSQDLFEEFAKLINYNVVYLFFIKLGLEAIEKYEFINDPSVMNSAQSDTKHLYEKFGSSFSALSKINLEEHTLNVFENAINVGKQKGRVMQIALPIVASLFHDFGKSEKIRKQLLNENVGQGYKAHADVSEMFLREIVSIDYHKKFPKNSIETIETLSKIVKNHHPNSNKMRQDTAISFVTQADYKARALEMKKIKEQLGKG